MDKQSKDYLDFCYKEYTRLAGVVQTHMHSSTDDFKLLGAVGFMLAWKPITTAFAEFNNALVVLLGFVAILFVTLITVLFNFMKQSIMLFYVNQMKYYEAEIRHYIKAEDKTIFSSVSHWTVWMETIQASIVQRFFGLFLGFILVFPTVMILLSSGSEWQASAPYAGAYFLIALILAGIVFQALSMITNKITAKLKAA